LPSMLLLRASAPVLLEMTLMPRPAHSQRTRRRCQLS